MDENLKKKIDERMSSIPASYKVVIDSFGWEKILENIGKENELYYDQIESLYIETFLVMLGLTNPEDFVYTLEDELVIDREKADKIAYEVNTQLLEPLREALAQKFPELENEDFDIEDEQTIQNSISNPPTSKPISFVEQKLGAPHSVSVNSAPIPIPPGEKYADPYREEF